MDNLVQSIQRHLGLSISRESLNHYSLLGIEPDASTDRIRSALRAAAAAWKASDTRSNPQESQHVAQLLKQAQSTLLDATKRKLYDETILAIAPIRGANVGAEPSWQPLELPAGNPLAPFDPTSFHPVKIKNRFSDVATRWRELQETVFAGEDPNNLQGNGPPVDVGNPTESVSFAKPSMPTKSNAPIDNTQSVATRIAQLRKKRQRNQNLVVGGILLAAVGLLAFASIRFLVNQQSVAKNEKADANPTRQLPSDVAEGTAKNSSKRNAEPAPSVRSNLPSISRDSDDTVSDDKDGVGDMAMDDVVVAPAGPTPMETITPPGTMTPPIAMTPMPTIPTNEPSPSPTPSPSPSDSPKWKVAMEKGKAALLKLDFEAFGKSMEEANTLSVGQEQTAKQKRLDQLGQLYQMSIDAMQEVRSKTRGTDVVTVGKNRVNIVEVKPDAVIIRVSGKNETHAWAALPMGLALAFLDLTLSEKEPTDLAARAVYLSLSTAKTDLYDKRIKEFFDKSVGKGDVREDLPQALTDTYE